MPDIYILSAPVQSGKTSRLLNWVKARNDVSGILAPIVDGKRYLQSIHSGELRLLEADKHNISSKIVKIGSHVFYEDTFAWGRYVLTSSLHHPAKWLIIDEIGPLELQGKGLEPAVHTVLRNVPAAVNVVLVIRFKMLQNVLQHYGLNPENTIPFNFK